MAKEIDINEELSKLIHFAYDLHKNEIDYDFHGDIPNMRDYAGDSYPIKRMKNGGIFGFRGYPNHSDSTVWTCIGVSVGKFVGKKFEFEFGLRIQANNKDEDKYFSLLGLKEGEKNVLDYDHSISWNSLSVDERKNYLIKVFTFMGFKKSDVIAVLEGKMTAREAYQHVAPEEIKNLQWVNVNRSYYWFDNNIAIEGSFSSIEFDKFPFPFSEHPILDCTKVKTSWIDEQSNLSGVELINVNKNEDSIKYSNLKNIIINEPIDLSLVNATNTVFGHHTVINLDFSIADLRTMDLTLAVDEFGNRFVVDEQGRVQVNDSGEILTTSSDIVNEDNNVLVYANADNLRMANDAIKNNADGIGLVRTEHILKEKNDIKDLIDYCAYYTESEEFEDRLTKLQLEQALSIQRSAKNKKIVFRLFDFKLIEYSLFSDLLRSDYESFKDLFKYRGARLLVAYPELYVAQLKAIFEVAEQYKLDFDLLVPMLHDVYDFQDIKARILEEAQNYQLNGFRIGGMIENVEMAQDADNLAKEADFITFGTNDLTESVTGFNRNTNKEVFEILSDDVKIVINEAVYRVRAVNPNIPIGFCGNHGNYVDNLDYYYDLGASYVSCDPAYVKTAKKVFENRYALNKGEQEIKRVLKKDEDKKN